MASIGEAPFPTSALAFIWHYVVRRRWHFGALGLLIIGGAGSAVMVQYGMGRLVDAMSNSGPERTAAWSPFLLFACLIASESLFWRTAGWLSARTIVATGVDIRLDLFQHASGHSMRYFSDHMAGALGNRITTTAGSITGLIQALTWNIIPPCTDLIGALLLFLTVDWRMAAVLLSIVLCVVGLLAWYGSKGRVLHQTYAQETNAVGGELVDTLANVWVVKAFSALTRERQRLARKLAVESNAQWRSMLHFEKIRIVHDATLWATSVLMLGWSVYLWTQSTISPGQVVMVSALTFRILFGSRDLALALIGTAQQFAVVTDALRVIGQRHTVADRPGARLMRPGAGRIELQNVTFAYPDRKPVFEGFSLLIPAGQKVGLVGLSGAGKTTLVSLVQRMEDAQGGEVLIDGQNVTTVTQSSLRTSIAVVPQDISLFHRSILENIRFGRADATDEEVVAAAKAAYSDDFIRALPQGYDTVVGERGAKLSGGQRQRIGIARAILKNAPILILDEATSALDSHSEAAIQRALATLMQGRTVLAVAHRLSTLSSLDRIIVLQDGRIIEDGPPSDLHRADGAFARLWKLQAQAFSRDEETAEAA
jgi:ATP-binding cassette subfamily B protein